MSDPTPVVDAEPAAAPASATVLPALIEAYPACFDWEHSQPLKIGLHRDLLAAGLGGGPRQGRRPPAGAGALLPPAPVPVDAAGRGDPGRLARPTGRGGHGGRSQNRPRRLESPADRPAGSAPAWWSMRFTLEERLLHYRTRPLLSGTDIRALLNHFLPRRDTPLAEVLRQMELRHRKRQAATDSACRRQQLNE